MHVHWHFKKHNLHQRTIIQSPRDALEDVWSQGVQTDDKTSHLSIKTTADVKEQSAYAWKNPQTIQMAAG